MKIGVFDSGIGGITVLHQAITILPDEDYIYYADTDHVPYGIKPKEKVREYIFKAVDFIVKQGIKALVIACNTATSVAIKDLRNRYDFPIIGMEPAVKPAVRENNGSDKRVLVLATPLTLKEEKFNRLLLRVDKEHIVDFLPAARLVEFAESFKFNGSQVKRYMAEKLSNFNLDNYSTMVLGCTHFLYFKSVIREVIPDDIDLIDGNKGTVIYLKKRLQKINALDNGSGKITYYNSENKPVPDKKYSRLLKVLDNQADSFN
ncbi:MAG: glutamate racemase [Halothermotrichaceae bacterium]